MRGQEECCFASVSHKKPTLPTHPQNAWPTKADVKAAVDPRVTVRWWEGGVRGRGGREKEVREKEKIKEKK